MDISLLINELKINFELKRIYYRMNKFAEDARSVSPILITSAADGEGKTIASLILALIFIEEGKKRCLLVDANWRNPSLHKWLDLKQDNTAARVIGDPASCVQFSGLEGLDIICAPRDIDNYMEISRTLAQGAITGFKEKLKTLSNNYDIVIIDGQSVFSKSMSILDPLYVASFAGFTIMTVLMRKTDRSLVKRAKMALEDVNRSLSVILNNMSNPIYATGGEK